MNATTVTQVNPPSRRRLQPARRPDPSPPVPRTSALQGTAPTSRHAKPAPRMASVGTRIPAVHVATRPVTAGYAAYTEGLAHTNPSLDDRQPIVPLDERGGLATFYVLELGR